MEVLGEGIAIEQMQELRGDQAFMTDLQGRLELKGSNLTAEQFLNEVEYNLDKRNLEDKSLDVVEGTVDSVVNEMITEDNVNDIEADVLSEAISKLLKLDLEHLELLETPVNHFYPLLKTLQNQ